MTTQPETVEPASDLPTEDGVAITPTASPVKPRLSDRPMFLKVAVIAMVVAIGIAASLIGSIVSISGSVKHELSSMTDTYTTYGLSGECLIEAFSVTEFNQDTFEQYQAKHPNEKPHDDLCRIVYENNTNQH